MGFKIKIKTPWFKFSIRFKGDGNIDGKEQIEALVSGDGYLGFNQIIENDQDVRTILAKDGLGPIEGEHAIQEWVYALKEDTANEIAQLLQKKYPTE